MDFHHDHLLAKIQVLSADFDSKENVWNILLHGKSEGNQAVHSDSVISKKQHCQGVLSTDLGAQYIQYMNIYLFVATVLPLFHLTFFLIFIIQPLGTGTKSSDWIAFFESYYGDSPTLDADF
jgi:hypothetical protein